MSTVFQRRTQRDSLLTGLSMFDNARTVTVLEKAQRLEGGFSRVVTLFAKSAMNLTGIAAARGPGVFSRSTRGAAVPTNGANLDKIAQKANELFAAPSIAASKGQPSATTFGSSRE